MASSYFIEKLIVVERINANAILLGTLSVRNKHIFYNGYGDRKLSRKTCGLPYAALVHNLVMPMCCTWIYDYPHRGDQSSLPWERIFEDIGRGGNVACLTWAIDRAIQGPSDFVDTVLYREYITRATDMAIQCGHISILKWVKDREPAIANRSLSCCSALAHSHWDCFVWCFDNGLVCHYSNVVRQVALLATAEDGDLSMFERLISHQLFLPSNISDCDNVRDSSEYIIDIAIESGLVEVLQWLYDKKKYNVTEDMIALAH